MIYDKCASYCLIFIEIVRHPLVGALCLAMVYHFYVHGMMCFRDFVRGPMLRLPLNIHDSLYMYDGPHTACHARRSINVEDLLC